jgi:hypothetical protein
MSMRRCVECGAKRDSLKRAVTGINHLPHGLLIDRPIGEAHWSHVPVPSILPASGVDHERCGLLSAARHSQYLVTSRQRFDYLGTDRPCCADHNYLHLRSPVGTRTSPPSGSFLARIVIHLLLSALACGGLVYALQHVPCGQLAETLLCLGFTSC